MQHFALCRLTNQFRMRRFDRLRRFLDDLPLRGRRQRNPQLTLKTLQPVKRNAVAVLDLRNHCRGSRAVHILFVDVVKSPTSA